MILGSSFDALRNSVRRRIKFWNIQLFHNLRSPIQHSGVRPVKLIRRTDKKIAAHCFDIDYGVETGTQNHEGIVGAGAAVEFLASLGSGATRRARLASAFAELHRRGRGLFDALWDGRRAGRPIRPYRPRPPAPRTPTVPLPTPG